MGAEPAFAFDLPDGAPREMEAIAHLTALVDQIRVATEDVAHRHHDLAEVVDKLTTDHAALRRQLQDAEKKRDDAPRSIRWDVLDRDTGAAVWTWLLHRVQWLVERYRLHEDLGECWPQHPALVEELTALCLAWHAAYDGGTGDAPLRWHEALERARRRWRDWDRHTKCRLGQHQDPSGGATWSTDWLKHATETARRDAEGRPMPPGAVDRGQVIT